MNSFSEITNNQEVLLHRPSKKKRIIIENLRKIQYADIELSDLSILVGYNNTGKSTIMKAIYLVLELYKRVSNLDTRESRMELTAMLRFNAECKDLSELLLPAFDLHKSRLIRGIFNSIEDNTRITLEHGEDKIVVSNTESICSIDLNNRSRSLDVTYISSSQILNYVSSIPTVSSERVGLSVGGTLPSYDIDLLQKIIPTNDIGNSPIILADRYYMNYDGEYRIPSDVGSGVQLGLILNALDQNGMLENSDHILLLDEPEELVEISEYIETMESDIFIVSHSPSTIYTMGRYQPNYYIIDSGTVNNTDFKLVSTVFIR